MENDFLVSEMIFAGNIFPIELVTKNIQFNRLHICAPRGNEALPGVVKLPYSCRGALEYFHDVIPLINLLQFFYAHDHLLNANTFAYLAFCGSENLNSLHLLKLRTEIPAAF